MSPLDDMVTLVSDRIRDGAAFVSTTQLESAMAQAVRGYSKHRPRVAMATLTSTGSYDLTLPASWVDGDNGSAVLKVEYPTGQQVPEYLEEGTEWTLYRSVATAPASTVKLRLLDVTPAVGATVSLTYTLPHTLDDTSNTVDSADRDAVVDLAASYALRQLASRMAQSTDSTIAADAVNYGQQPTNYTMLADRYLRQYRDHMGLGEGGQDGAEAAAALVILDVDVGMSWGGDRLTHPRRWF